MTQRKGFLRKQAMCLRKQRFATEEGALERAEQYRASGAKKGKDVALRAYPCDYGSHWHVTKDVKREGVYFGPQNQMLEFRRSEA